MKLCTSNIPLLQQTGCGLNHGRKIDLNTEAVSAQIDHLCHLNNLLSVWWKYDARRASRHHLIIKTWRSLPHRHPSGSRVTICRLRSSAVNLQPPLKLHFCGLMFAQCVLQNGEVLKNNRYWDASERKQSPDVIGARSQHFHRGTQLPLSAGR